MSHQPLDLFADRYIETVLEVSEAIERGEAVDPRTLHATLTEQLKAGRRQMGHDDDWGLVAYALASWTDELMLQTAWPGQAWWKDRVLEAEIFNSRLCGERFFELAKVAAANPSSGALRVFHDCVLLGFQGVYADADVSGESVVHGSFMTEAVTRDLGLPPTLAQWLSETQDRMVMGTETTSVDAKHHVIGGAPPLAGRRQLVWWMVAACTLLAINMTVYTMFRST